MRTQRELKAQRNDRNLCVVEQERELKRQRTSKAFGKQFSCFSDRLQSANTSTEEEGNRNEGNEEAFSSDQAIAVNEGEKIEAKTVKDTECQTIEF